MKIEPKTLSEQMLYNTVRLTTSDGSTGTGFFFEFTIGDMRVPVIVTNKHVINNNPKELVNFSLHTKDGNVINIQFATNWTMHKDKDLCFCFVAPLITQIKEKQNKDVFYISINEKIILDSEKMQELSAIEDVVMVGYPNGLWDKENNFPIFRKGITASHPATDFNNKNIGAVDMACFPGSSGSPIFILNENGYSDKKGVTHMAAKRIIFLGVLFQGPQLNAKGDLVIEDIPTKQKISLNTPVMINLGYYIKSSEVLSFKSEIEASIAKK